MALVRRQCRDVPAVLYMHENQLTYPLPDSTDTGPMRRQKGERDLHYAFINFASMLAADKIYFNSAFHREDLFLALPGYLRHFPEYNELVSIRLLQAKSDVLPPGIDGRHLDRLRPAPLPEQAPLVIWNQRWEFDKGPGQFFSALSELARQGLPFRLAVCGEHFSSEPPEFARVREHLGERIVQWGYAQPDDYARLLWQASITGSTALHEFFGISIVEALYCRTFAVLPRRLSYPELLPAALHRDCLYDSPEQLSDRLAWAIMNPEPAQAVADRLSRAAAVYDWRQIAQRYDAEFVGLL
jgi:glycosyltransferase involved in cell wall biosynthesis